MVMVAKAVAQALPGERRPSRMEAAAVTVVALQLVMAAMAVLGATQKP